ncbi:uncharacterized protein LOC129314687 [Prosopis cineraria]|uniref:uncharacterized protein LOC129314687 n=1 Tax=Prosopis cineraria TaxID=364024 RepID=UPI00240EFE22|nr:uncharacterized protein LOC129314687 [Prosopis cineraria]
MSSSDGVQKKEKVEKLRRDAREGKWYDVLETYKKERELRTEKITEKGDTALHVALAKDVHWAASKMVSFILEEEEKTVLKDKVEDGAIISYAREVFGAKNKKGNTVLHLAARVGNLKVCKKIGKREPSLLSDRNFAGETPLFVAVLHGNKQAFLWLHYLYTESYADSSATKYANCTRDNNDTILHCAIEKGCIDIAMEIFHLYEDLVKSKEMKRNDNGLSPLHLLAVTPSAFKSTALHGRFFTVHLAYRLFSVKKKEGATAMEKLKKRERASLDDLLSCLESCSSIVFDNRWVKSALVLLGYIMFAPVVLPVYLLFLFLLAGEWLRDIRKMKEEHEWYGQIMNGLLEHVSDEEMLKIKHDDSEPGSIIVETPLMIAARNGATEMVERIVELFPSRIKDVNGEKKNIVLLAAENRQTKLYQFLSDQKDETIPDSAFSQVDEDGNTALHLAAMNGANLNMQTTTMIEEFKWFEFVKKSMPPDLLERYNNDGKTADKIFQDSYNELMTSDREWLNQTSQACSVVSTLVSSIVFPMVVESSNDKGKSIFRNKFGFKAFPNLYLVALALSLISTISFLGILASRYQSVSIWRYIPFMLQIGMSFMFGSIFSLWIALMLHDDHSPTTYGVLGSPIAILIILLLPIFIGPTLMSLFSKVPAPSRGTVGAIRYRRTKKKEHATDLNPRN